jgi:alpha-D-xyloside xylohydrolase
MPGGEGTNERSPLEHGRGLRRAGIRGGIRFWNRLRKSAAVYLPDPPGAASRKAAPGCDRSYTSGRKTQTAVDCEDEYLFGDGLLVAPLLEENAEDRPVSPPPPFNGSNSFSRKKYDCGQRPFARGERASRLTLSARTAKLC